MGLYLCYTCDACGAKDEARPRYGMAPIGQPSGWYRVDGRDLCGLPCVARYAGDPAGVPKARWDPDPMHAALRDSIAEKLNDVPIVTDKTGSV